MDTGRYRAMRGTARRTESPTREHTAVIGSVHA